MLREQRYDIGELRKPERTPEGFLKVDARLTRTGVFTYRRGDGSIRRELRLAEEVFSADSLKTFHLAPLTLGHPGTPVVPESYKSLTVGSVGEVTRDGKFQRAMLSINDAGAIAAVEGGVREISNGYYCDVEERSGEYGGERFDAIQRNIRGNHVAIVSEGRAGPEAAIRVDAQCGVMVTDDSVVFDDENTQDVATGDKEHKMQKITIDDVDYEGSEQLAQAVSKLMKDHANSAAVASKNIVGLTAKVDSLAKEIVDAKATEAARADAAEERLAVAEEALSNAIDPAAVQARIDERMSLERTARGYVGDDADFSSATDRQIKEQVIMAVSPKAKLDDKDDAYIAVRWDASLESEPTRVAKVGEGVKNLHVVSTPKTDAREPIRDSVQAKSEMEARNRDAWKTPLSGSVNGAPREIKMSDAGLR